MAAERGIAGMEAIILAGGLGTRLRSVVPELPKPMAPVAGRPFLEHLLDYWLQQGVSAFVLSVGYCHEVIKRHFGGEYRKIPIVYAIEETPLGTGGGLLGAIKALARNETTLVLNGDTFFPLPLSEMLQFHRARNANITLALFPTKKNRRYDKVSLDENARIQAFGDVNAEDGFANGGVYLIDSPAGLATRWPGSVARSLERDILPAEITKGKAVCGFRSDAIFLDIGVPEDYVRADDVLANHRSRSRL